MVVEVRQPVVAALDQAQRAIAVTRAHLAPVEQFVALRDHGQQPLGMRDGRLTECAQFGEVGLRELETLLRVVEWQEVLSMNNRTWNLKNSAGKDSDPDVYG